MSAEKRELAKVIAAIVADTDAKMDEPDTYDRGYVLEDLLGRLVGVIAPFTSETFEAWQDHRLAYPEMLARDESGLVRPYIARHVEKQDAETATYLRDDVMRAIREVRQLQTWDGVGRHVFEAGHSGAVCVRMVERHGFGEDCGLPYLHPIHETEA